MRNSSYVKTKLWQVVRNSCFAQKFYSTKELQLKIKTWKAVRRIVFSTNLRNIYDKNSNNE